MKMIIFIDPYEDDNILLISIFTDPYVKKIISTDNILLISIFTDPCEEDNVH
jgi:hypothetical protein